MYSLKPFLSALASSLWGCGHRRKAFPITLQQKTYVVCLDCGRQFPYDWRTMRATRRRVGLIVPLLLLTGFSATSYAQVPQPYQLSVNVDLVLLNVAVRDRAGSIVSDLSEQNFEVYEDGARQAIRLFRHEDVPVTVGLVVDHSGSMRPKLADVIAAAKAFVQSSSPEDQMFVVNFNEKVMLGLPRPISFTNRPDELARAISNEPATGMTALYDAVIAAQQQLLTGSREKKVLLVISDGGDNASKHSLPEVLRLAGQSSALVYAIGIFAPEDSDRNPDSLKRLAHATGGEAYFPRRFNEVEVICEHIAHEIRHQYTVGYVSNNPRPGVFRAVQVIARSAGKSRLSVRTRSGYIAAGEVVK